MDLYDPGHIGEEIIYPLYGDVEALSQEELRHCRALYAGEVTMVDTWVGRLLQRVQDLGLRDNTAVFFIADHGFVLGEQGWIGKGSCPLYEPLNHVPLLARVPDVAGGRRLQAYAQAADLMPTILELAGAPDPGTMHGQSLVPLLRGEIPDRPQAVRDVCVSTTSLATGAVAGALPGRLKSMIQAPGWAMLYGPGAQPRLYDMANDPGQTRDVYESHRDIAGDLHRRYVRWLQSVRTPEHILAPIRGDSL